MRKFLTAFLAFISSQFLGLPANAGSRADRPRVLVVPFENLSKAVSQEYLSLALPITLAEQLEDEPSLIMLNGPRVLTEQQAVLVRPRGQKLDPASVFLAAQAAGATHVVTGSFTGQEWDWTLTVEVASFGPPGLKVLGQGSVHGTQTLVEKTVLTGKYGQSRVFNRNTVSAVNVQRMLAEAAETAFERAGLPLSAAVRASLRIPSTNDSWAYILLARAFFSLYEVGTQVQREPIDLAANAVSVDPAWPEAQRFYAGLLLEEGQKIKARIHYEVALSKRPSDMRVLLALAAIEAGDGNDDVAGKYLKDAIRFHPADPRGHRALGTVLAKLGMSDEAVSEYETARGLDPADLETRRALSGLYSAAKRYEDAARELSAVVAGEPGNLEAALQLAACLRAGGREKEAAEAYAEAGPRFRKDARPHKFRGDILRQMGLNQEAFLAYAQALKVPPRDKRILQMLETPAGGKELFSVPELLGGERLVKAVEEGSKTAAEIEETRAEFQDAANDAAMDLAINGKAACKDGGGISSSLLAADLGKLYFKTGAKLDGITEGLEEALKDGESAYLTPDELQTAREVIASTVRARRDLAEMLAQYQDSLLPMLRQYGCPTGGQIAAADILRSRERNLDRRVSLPEVKPPQWGIPISPDVPTVAARPIRFLVDNTLGALRYELTLDGTAVGEVAPGSKATFVTEVGLHQFCLVPKGRACGPVGTVRSVFLHEGWKDTVKPAHAF